MREAGLPDPEHFVLKTLLPLIWCTAAVSIVGTVFTGLDLRSTASASTVYLLLLTPVIPRWRAEWIRLRG